MAGAPEVFGNVYDEAPTVDHRSSLWSRDGDQEAIIIGFARIESESIGVNRLRKHS